MHYRISLPFPKKARYNPLIGIGTFHVRKGEGEKEQSAMRTIYPGAGKLQATQENVFLANKPPEELLEPSEMLEIQLEDKDMWLETTEAEEVSESGPGRKAQHQVAMTLEKQTLQN